MSSSQDPRRENRVYRYTPVTNKPSEDPLPDYINLLGMLFSMLGLMMRVSGRLFVFHEAVSQHVFCFWVNYLIVFTFHCSIQEKCISCTYFVSVFYGKFVSSYCT